MALSKEQAEQIKQQIIGQIEKTFPEEKKEFSINQIKEMDDDQLENFLVQNNLVKSPGTAGEQCIFCSIIQGEISSYKIYENENTAVVLEINPISRGHTILIPKLHVQEASKQINEIAKKISFELKKKLNAKEIQINESEMFGHKILNLIPVYDSKSLEGKRQHAPKDILESLQKELEIKKIEEEPEKKQEKIEKKPEIISDKNTILPKRIP